MKKQKVNVAPMNIEKEIGMREVLVIEKLYELEGFAQVVGENKDHEELIQAIESKAYYVGRSLGDNLTSEEDRPMVATLRNHTVTLLEIH